MMQSENEDEIVNFDRGQQQIIPGFSFFGARDYMNKADASKSVHSIRMSNSPPGVRDSTPERTSQINNKVGIETEPEHLPRFASAEGS